MRRYVMPEKNEKDIAVPEIPGPPRTTTFYGTEEDTLKMEEFLKRKKKNDDAGTDANQPAPNKK